MSHYKDPYQPTTNQYIYMVNGPLFLRVDIRSRDVAWTSVRPHAPPGHVPEVDRGVEAGKYTQTSYAWGG